MRKTKRGKNCLESCVILDRPKMKLPRNEVIVGDAKEVLERLPENSVDMSMTSPPYWGLRDYGEESVTVWGRDPSCEHQWVPHKVSLEHENRNFQEGTQEEVHGEKGTTYIKKYDDKKADFCQKCGAWKGQLGLEPTPDLFVKHLVTIFEKLKKPLKPWGTLYVVIADTYGGGSGHNVKDMTEEKISKPTDGERLQRNVKAKCLLMIPERFAMAMINNGWILRNKTIWHKPNAMPSSVKDRLNTTWEYVYMFAQQQKYWWNLDAIREPHKTGKWEEMPPIGGKKHKGKHPTYSGNTPPSDPKGKNPGDSVEVPESWGADKKGEYHGEGKKDPHGKAQAPSDLKRNIIESFKENPKGKNPGDYWSISTKPFPEAHFAVYPPSLCEKPIKAGCPEKVCQKCGKPKIKKPDFKNIPVCRCDEPEWKNGIVLDPFAGAGSTWVMARKLGRDFIGIEIVEEYAEMARERIPDARLDKFL